MNEHLNAFLEGWRRGDATMILGALADDFVHDDPIDGHFTRAEFESYLKEVFTEPSAVGGFEIITDLVTGEEGGVETAWGWWKTATQEGAGLVKAGPEGVRSEKVAYYTLP